MDVKGLVGYADRPATELNRRSIFVLENPVLIKTKLGRNVRKRLGLVCDSSPQRTNRAGLAVFAQCSAANPADAIHRSSFTVLLAF
jgi:hypothetical protein